MMFPSVFGENLLMTGWMILDSEIISLAERILLWQTCKKYHEN